MDWNLIANILFAVSIIRLIELATEHFVGVYNAKKRKAQLDKLMKEMRESLSQFSTSKDDGWDDCCDDDCDLCDDYGDYVTFERVTNTTPVKKKTAAKKPVKKAVAKKKTVKKTAPKKGRK